MAGRGRVFQHNPELQRFVLPDVRPTGKQLGVGSYGCVEELEMNGLLCAGKGLHDTLLQRDNVGVANIEQKFLEECQVMAELRHPHIVQFLGLCFLEGSVLPVLVMERLDSSLNELLEGAPGLPLALKRSLLADVARGLLYLHTRNPPVVHRDLSARNVLLTPSLVAKISDLGNARIVNLLPGQLARTLTHVPGTMVYMPPEAFDDPPRYGPRLDIFSFGHLTLFTLTQVFPSSLLPHTYVDTQNPDHLFARSEVERRREYFQPLYRQLGEEHPLVQLVHRCLRNTPARRPSAEELLEQLEAVRHQIEGPYGHIVKVDMEKVKAIKEKVRALREKDTEIRRLQQQLQQLEEDRRRLQVDVKAKGAHLQQKDGQLHQQGVELQERATQISRQQRELQILTEDRRRLHAEVEVKAGEIDRQQKEIQALRERLEAEVDARVAQVQEKDAEISRLQRELQTLKAEMSSQPQQQLKERDAEIGRLRRDLTISRKGSTTALWSLLQPRPISEVRLTWRKLADMPQAMWEPQSTVVQDAVYIRGRRGGTGDIHRYDPQTQQWTRLPPYKYCYFTLAEVNNQLTVVGGEDVFYPYKTSNEVAVYSISEGWVQPYPHMNTPRRYPSVCTYHHHLVVAGGCDGVDLATVEIFDTISNGQWLSTAPLPLSCNSMSSSIIQDELYLLGGSLGKQVLSISLPALTQTEKPPAQWHTLPNAPLEFSTAIALYGSLLAVGGCHNKQRSSSIHFYNQEKNMWIKMGDLPTIRDYCTSCLLPSGKILVAGGQDRNGWTKRMDCAAVNSPQ